MPCRCDGYPEPTGLDLHNGALADMLCTAMQEHEARGEMNCFTAEQLAWWAEHKQRDAARIQQDLKAAQTTAAREAALAKLTPFERSLLGL